MNMLLPSFIRQLRHSKLWASFSLCLALALVHILVGASIASASGPGLKRGAGFTVVVRTEQLKDYVKFQGSPLQKMVRVKVQYFAGQDDSNAESYEEFFYSRGEVIGLRRLKDLGLNPMNSYVINLVHKDGSADTDEERSGVNAAIRVWMNFKRKHCMLTALVVPDGGLSAASEELRRLRFQPIQAPSEGSVDYSTILTVFESQSGEQRYFAYTR
jgi:hypothetical protein